MKKENGSFGLVVRGGYDENPSRKRPFTVIHTAQNGSTFTGYSLSDQQVLSPINPTYDSCQIYTNCSEIQKCLVHVISIGRQVTNVVLNVCFDFFSQHENKIWVLSVNH